jgi:DNA-binding NtrC family response regulator
MADTVLLVGGDRLADVTIREVLERAGAEIVAAPGGSALMLYDRVRPDFVAFAPPAEDAGATEVLTALVARGAVVLTLAGAGTPLASRALALGAEQLLVRPIEREQVSAAVERVRARIVLRREHDWVHARRMARGGLETLGTSASMRALARRIEQTAREDGAPVLLVGEVGTGKAWVGRLIHELDPARIGPFVEAGQAMSEVALFGQEAGAPGDGPRRAGLLDLSERGTLYFDEIADLAPDAQGPLATVLASGTMRRLGGARELPVRVRIIAATERDLSTAVRDGAFLPILHDRLGPHTIRIPAVRERTREDRMALVDGLVAELASHVPDVPSGCTPEARERLVAAPWPGNVRELRAVLERALLLARGAPALHVQHLPADLQDGRPASADQVIPGSRPVALSEVEREYIERALRYHRGNRTRAAHDLGISRATLINKIKVYALDL